MASIVLAVIVTDKDKGHRVLSEAAQPASDIHGAAAEAAVDAIELNGQVYPGMVGEAGETAAVVGHVVYGQGSGHKDA